jgi:hypothetical protein
MPRIEGHTLRRRAKRRTALRPRQGGAIGSLLLIGLASCGEGTTGLNCGGGTPIAIGETLQGVLEEGDLTDVDGAFLDRYSLAITPTANYQITMRSDELDAYLWLIQGGFNVIAANDNFAGSENGTDARIARGLLSGCYIIEATSAEPGETGTYTLTVQRL